MPLTARLLAMTALVICGITPTVAATAVSASQAPLIIPRPKSVRMTGANVKIDSAWPIYVARNAPSLDRQAAVVIAEALGKSARVGSLDDWDGHRPAIIVGEPKRWRLVRRLCQSTSLVPRARREAYRLITSQNLVLIAGNDSEGTFAGAETLCQILDQRAERNGAVPAMRIDDYPALSWRGVHLFAGGQALPFHICLVSRVFSRCHLNKLVIECEQAKWDSTCDVAPDWGMSKQDLVLDATNACNHGMEIIPLIESAAHMAWLLNSPKYRPYAEDPKIPFAVQPADRRVYNKLFPLYDEVIDTLHPHRIHVGCDELTLRGRYPYKSRARFATPTDALVAHLLPIRQHLGHRGVSTMIWGDMLVGAGEGPDPGNAPPDYAAGTARRLMPKDLTVCDWHYRASGPFPSLSAFKSAGFHNVVAGTWRSQENVVSFSRAAARAGIAGTLQTTWCGYNSSEANIASNADQFAAMVLSAEESWNGGQIALADLNYDPWVQFQRLYGKQFAANHRRY